MTLITKIEATIATSDLASARTDGRVFLGICGREFHCDRTGESFERAMERVYRFGDGSNVLEPSMNDPARPQLIVEDADRYPIYIRFEDKDLNHWKVKSVKVRVNGNGPEYVSALSELWMGFQAGAFCYLKRP